MRLILREIRRRRPAPDEFRFRPREEYSMRMTFDFPAHYDYS